ncbi:MAG TPA: mevalonate kinase [Nitrososphaerales archaeon]|nr:mevalonate kinase [Nitrososphaerales archaeon]
MKAIAEAPSKAIITGEHFVVHGAWALAAALPLRVRVEVSQAPSLAIRSDRFEGRDSPELRPVSRVVEGMARQFSVTPSVRVSISSEIPEGAGLGSSAATMVAVASAFSRLHSLGLKVDELVRCSMVGERFIHGRPSGIDPTVCAYGGVVLFKRGSKPRRLSMDGTRSLIITYSGEKRSTKGQIGRVSVMRERFPGLFAMLAGAVSELGFTAAEKLRQGDMEGLGRVLAINQAALETIGVSNEAINGIVDLLGSLGCYGAKLTGAGGGGSVVAVAPKAKEKSIVSGLSARGFETFKVKVPTEGVRSWLER